MQPTWRDVFQSLQQYRDVRMEHWLNENLFTSTWWILLVTTLGIFIIWLIVLDKKRILEIITYGFFVTAIGIIGDAVGATSLLWHYPNTLLPITLIAEIHSVQMPIIYMLIYQYFRTWKSFLIATTINAFIFAFMLEPLLVWLRIYEMDNWKHIYSFIPYIMIAIVVKLVVDKFKQMSQNAE